MQIISRAGTRVTIIPTGRMLADGGAMFGRVPKTLWRECFAADADNNITLGTCAVLIERPESLTLFDAGPGNHYRPAERAAYGLFEEAARLPGRVDQVVLSHLHYDHCGGVHELATSEILVSADEWQAALKPDELSAESIRPCDLKAIAPRLRLIEGPTAIAPGLEVLFTPGHTAGHLSLLIDDEILCPADLVPTRAHVRLDWIMAYDLWPLSVLEHKRRLLDLAAKRGWRLILPHDPEPALVTVTAEGPHFAWRQAEPDN